MAKYVRIISKSRLLGVDILIFVILGTQNKKFVRLLNEIERLIDKEIIKEKVIVQAGFTKFQSNKMEIKDYLTMNEFQNLIRESSYVITHGGVGSILDSIKNNKKVIAVARLKEYNEHTNNHQLQIINEFSKLGYILGSDIENLEENILNLRKFKPKKYKSNNKNMINHLIEYMEEI